MKPITGEWIAIAGEDYATLLRELRARKNPSPSSACFHAQQCVEKYLKAVLQEESVAFAKTHDVLALLRLVLSVEPAWADLDPSLGALTDYAVGFRYPGESAGAEEVSEASRVCRDLRVRARARFGLAP